ncbi:hypothetical protein BS47DRAFT_1344060 [Hydnum rufescens UP504]|uniref:KN homeodomain domain-containing protein n=1 Tax=Hydnum rufescens UP504 TaxID=1448309 RepID=A0A9P6AX28_9AGAM|nr:hypothetical protein BS47DRAFT_1344060 [Hydnum rufescens UP504]
MDVLFDHQLDSELRSAIAAAETRVLEVLREAPESMEHFHRDFEALLHRSRKAICDHVISPRTCTLIRTTVSTIRTMMDSFLEMERLGEQVKSDIRAATQRILSEASRSADKSPSRSKVTLSKKSKKEEAPSTDTTKYRPCRDYFMANFGSPYPSAASKQVMAETNWLHGGSVNQWFTNYRRRSGLPEPVVAAVRAVHQYIDRLATPPLSLEELAQLKAERRNARKERVEAKKVELKRKRVAEDRAAKNGHAAAAGTQVVPVAGKRKRNAEDTSPDGDRPTKKRGGPPSNMRPKNPNVHVPLRNRYPLPSAKPVTPAPNSSLRVTKRDGKRKAIEDHDTQTPEPRYPTEHKRRRPNPKACSSHVPFDPRIVSAPSGMDSHTNNSFGSGPEWNHTPRAASLPGNLSMGAVPEQSRRLEIFHPDPRSANEFMQFHEPVRLDQASLPLMNISPDLMASFDADFLAAFQFGHTPAGDDYFPANESSSSPPLHAFRTQTSPLQHWSPPTQTLTQDSFSPGAGRAAPRVTKAEIQRLRLATEEKLQRLKRLEEEASQDDIAATFVA